MIRAGVDEDEDPGCVLVFGAGHDLPGQVHERLDPCGERCGGEHLPGAHVQAGEQREGALAPVFVLVADGSAGSTYVEPPRQAHSPRATSCRNSNFTPPLRRQGDGRSLTSIRGKPAAPRGAVVPSSPWCHLWHRPGGLPRNHSGKEHREGRCHHLHGHGDAVQQPPHPQPAGPHQNDTVNGARPSPGGHPQRRVTDVLIRAYGGDSLLAADSAGCRDLLQEERIGCA